MAESDEHLILYGSQLHTLPAGATSFSTVSLVFGTLSALLCARDPQAELHIFLDGHCGHISPALKRAKRIRGLLPSLLLRISFHAVSDGAALRICYGCRAKSCNLSANRCRPSRAAVMLSALFRRLVIPSGI